MVARMRIFAVALPVALILGAFSAQAQINPYSNTDATLTPADIEKMRAASLPLYSADPPVVGATAEWSDPETGNFGAVKLGEAYTWHGLSCRRLHHAIKITGSRDPISIVVDRCKTAKGEWKIRY